MSLNIGWTRKQALAIAKKHNATHLSHHAYAQREDGWPITSDKDWVMQWIVVLEKKK